jgi:hypothetical protein
MAANAAIFISAEKLANSIGATGGLFTILSNTFQLNVSSSANVANGQQYRISVAGINPPLLYGSESIQFPTTLQVAIGSNTNAADPVVCQTTLPVNALNGTWAAEFLVTCRLNAAGQGANGNTQWSVVCLGEQPQNSPFFNPSSIIINNGTANGISNVGVLSAANLVCLTVLGAANTGSNANSLVELCTISQVQ